LIIVVSVFFPFSRASAQGTKSMNVINLAVALHDAFPLVKCDLHRN